jgi:stage IV sporulation protein B
LLTAFSIFCLLFSFGSNSYAYFDSNTAGRAELSASSNREIEVGSRFKDLIFGKKEEPKKETYLCPGGDAFGVKICGTGVTVTKVSSSKGSEQLREYDRILKINKKDIFTVDDVENILEDFTGGELEIEISRDGKVQTISVTPRKIGEDYHLGVVLSDSAAGIGTITYYDPETKCFGGLGHGICMTDGAEILKMTRGEATSVILAGAKKGVAGKPGELRGVLTDKIIGSIFTNTECGVFGKLNVDDAKTLGESAIPVASKSEVSAGSATIISTIKSGKRAEYSVEIKDIDYSSEGNKSFKIHVTDPALIALTGGIVRGMSGSPIIQNGKLVGAVTHVMVANPTEGYGIFIENMLNAAQDQVIPKAA